MKQVVVLRELPAENLIEYDGFTAEYWKRFSQGNCESWVEVRDDDAQTTL